MARTTHIALLIVGLSISVTASARILNVPGEYQTIQAGINAAENRDTVLVQPGEYNECIDYVGKIITVTSTFILDGDENIIGNTIIDGQGEGSVVTFAQGETADAKLIGLTLTNGVGLLFEQGEWQFYYGGGIYCRDASPSIQHCIIDGNIIPDGELVTGYGGGVYSREGSLIMEDCVISNNYAANEGGGFYVYDGSPELVRCTIRANSARRMGGGIGGGAATLRECLIEGNSADPAGNRGSGGGISGMGITIDNCIIRDNLANNGGGLLVQLGGTITNSTFSNNSSAAIVCIYSDAHFDRCTIVSNTATRVSSLGAGINIQANSGMTGDPVVITHCEIINNTSEMDGGGISCTVSATPLIESCLIAGNVAQSGGGVSCRDSNPTIRQCSIAGNTAVYAFGVSCAGTSHPSAVNSVLWNDDPVNIGLGRQAGIDLAYTCIAGGRDGIDGDAGSVRWGDGNIDADPLFLDPDNGDYHLTADSPCIDAGDPAAPPDPDGTRADIGAFFFHQRDIAVEPGELDFGNVQGGGGPFQTPLRVSNIGLTDLAVSAVYITPDGSPFTVNPDNFVLGAEESTELGLVVNLGVYGEYRGELVIVSNDPDEDTLRIPLHINSLGVPSDNFQFSIFNLQSSYPSPFNSTLTVDYRLDRPSSIRLSLTNLNGREVCILDEGFRLAGERRVSVELPGLPSGVYYMTLRADAAVRVAKVVCLK